MNAIRQIGIVGGGLSGSAIARLAALAGYQVHICEISQDTLNLAFEKSSTFLRRQALRGKISNHEVREVLARVHGTIDIHDLKDSELIIEAVPEDLATKTRVMKEADHVCSENTVFASHTSSLSVTEIATATQRPDKVVGLHFFHPIHVMKLVEIVQTSLVDRTILDSIHDFVKSLKKEPIIVGDSPGFIVNRLLIAYLFGAIRMFESGVATKENIDKAMEVGCGYPMGPFALIDFMGLDHVCTIAEHLYQECQDQQFSPPPLLKRLVEAGNLGKKSGKGFYKYP